MSLILPLHFIHGTGFCGADYKSPLESNTFFRMAAWKGLMQLESNRLVPGQGKVLKLGRSIAQSIVDLVLEVRLAGR